MAIIACKIDGCELFVTPKSARGMCPKHYQAYRKETAPQCSVEGCASRSSSKGYCNMHNHRLRATGAIGSAETYRVKSGGTCSGPECVREALTMGYCGTHYNQNARGVQLSPIQERANEKYCTVCGSENGNFRSLEFCSSSCKSRSFRARQKAKGLTVTRDRKVNIDPNAPVLACLFCGTEVAPDALHRNYCSGGCYNNFRKGYVHGEKTFCANCSEEISGRIRSARWCNSTCQSKFWRTKYPERDRAMKLAWYHENLIFARECSRNNQNRRRAIKENNGVFDVSAKDIQRLMYRFGNCCAYCGQFGKMHIDHIVPIARGGQHAIGNLIPACQTCNTSKGSKFLSEWKRWKALKTK